MKKTYKTKQREILMNFFQSRPNQKWSASDVCSNVSTSGISRSAIYRNLDRLVEEGELHMCIAKDGNHAMFEYRSCGNNCDHIHMQCMKCGKTFHMEDEEEESLLKSLIYKNGLCLDEKETVLKGICHACNKQ